MSYFSSDIRRYTVDHMYIQFLLAPGLPKHNAAKVWECSYTGKFCQAVGKLNPLV